MNCSEFLGFCFGSDAWSTLLRVWWIPLPEVPPGRICILRCSKPSWDLNLGCSRRKSYNAFVVSELGVGFCLSARFRCSPFPLHLNQESFLLKLRNRKSLNVLRLIFWVLFGFRCMCCSASPFVDALAISTSMAHLHSAVFQTRLGSEPRVQLLKVPQCVCCERVGCRILPCRKVQMLPFSAASEPRGMLDESSQ